MYYLWCLKGDVKTRSLKKNRTLSEPTTSKGILSKVQFCLIILDIFNIKIIAAHVVVKLM